MADRLPPRISPDYRRALESVEKLARKVVRGQDLATVTRLAAETHGSVSTVMVSNATLRDLLTALDRVAQMRETRDDA